MPDVQIAGERDADQGERRQGGLRLAEHPAHESDVEHVDGTGGEIGDHDVFRAEHRDSPPVRGHSRAPRGEAVPPTKQARLGRGAVPRAQEDIEPRGCAGGVLLRRYQEPPVTHDAFRPADVSGGGAELPHTARADVVELRLRLRGSGSTRTVLHDDDGVRRQVRHCGQLVH